MSVQNNVQLLIVLLNNHLYCTWISQAAADAYGLQINLLTSYECEPLIEIKPEEVKSSRVIWLTFWAEIHYNAVAVPDKDAI